MYALLMIIFALILISAAVLKAKDVASSRRAPTAARASRVRP